MTSNFSVIEVSIWPSCMHRHGRGSGRLVDRSEGGDEMNARLAKPLQGMEAQPVFWRIRPHAREDDDKLVFTVDYNGLIAECNRAVGRLLGCLPSELIWQPISNLLPKLADIALVKDQTINPYLRFLSRAGYQFDLTNVKGAHIACRVFFCEVGSIGHRFLKVIVCPVLSDSMAAGG